MKLRTFILVLVVALWGVAVCTGQDKTELQPQSSSSQSASSQVVPEKPAQFTPATLTFQNREIVTFRGKVAGLAPEQRVLASKSRLQSLSDFEFREPLKLQPVRDGELLLIGPHLIGGVFSQDVDPASGKNLHQIAEQAAANLRGAIQARQEQRKIPVILRGVGLSLIATIVFVILLVQLARLRTYLLSRISHRTASVRLGHGIFGFELQNVVMTLLQALSRVVILVVFLLLAYQWLTFVLRRFPYTYPWGQTMRGFLFGKISNLVENGIEAFPGLVTVLIILFLGRLLTQAIKQFFDGIESGRFPVPGVYAETAGATRRLVNALIWLLTLVIAYPYFPGSQSPAFKGVSVFVGLIFTLGSAGIVNHLMSGLVLVYSRAFKQGDFIRIGEVEGTVLEVGPLSVKLVTKKREELTIPNTVMTSSIVTNYTRLSKEEGLILSTSVTIGYDAPWRQVHELLKLAARRTSGLRKTPEPFVIQAALTDFYVDYRLCISPERPDDRIRVLSELHQNIQDAFNEYGVQILSPNFEAQPDHSVVVPKEKWFSAPAVRPDTKEEKES